MGNQGELYFGFFLTQGKLLFAMLILGGFLALAYLVSLWRIYSKASKPGISAIVPIWSQIVMFQIVDKPWWYLFLLFIPIVNIVIMIQTYISLAKKFGRNTGFAVGMLLLPMIFIPLLSFYDYVDEKKVEEPVYNPFNQTEVNQVMPTAPLSNESVVENPVPVVEGMTVENVNSLGAEVNPISTVDSSLQPSIPEEVLNSNVVTNDDLNNVQNTDLQVNIPEVENVIPVIEEPIVNEVVNNNSEINQFQDIQNVAYNSVNENVNIAFGSQANDNVSNNAVTIESLESDLGISNTVSPEMETNEKTVEENIELPEIAAKICPACGVSLAEDVKFCTSCGTQL